jgi:hypothetical protein
MSVHNIPTTIDLERLREKIRAQLREPSGVVFANGTISAPTALEFTPDLSAQDVTTLTTIVEQEQSNYVSKEDAIAYFRNSLAQAAGNLSALNTLYNQARTYEQNTPALSRTMLSLKAIWELADANTINISTNQGKAQYLRAFMIALALWS